MNVAVDDPGDLSRLHDIVVLPPVSWWPPAPAWYAVGAVVMVGVIAVLVRMILTWRTNWYRRAGLAELQRLEQTRADDAAALIDLAELVKRVALVAYPRKEVAAMTGAEWLRFLDRTANVTAFSSGPGRLLESVYDRAASSPTPELFQLVRLWIRQHRRETPC